MVVVNGFGMTAPSAFDPESWKRILQTFSTAETLEQPSLLEEGYWQSGGRSKTLLKIYENIASQRKQFSILGISAGTEDIFQFFQQLLEIEKNKNKIKEAISAIYLYSPYSSKYTGVDPDLAAKLILARALLTEKFVPLSGDTFQFYASQIAQPPDNLLGRLNTLLFGQAAFNYQPQMAEETAKAIAHYTPGVFKNDIPSLQTFKSYQGIIYSTHEEILHQIRDLEIPIYIFTGQGDDVSIRQEKLAQILKAEQITSDHSHFIPGKFLTEKINSKEQKIYFDQKYQKICQKIGLPETTNLSTYAQLYRLKDINSLNLDNKYQEIIDSGLLEKIEKNLTLDDLLAIFFHNNEIEFAQSIATKINGETHEEIETNLKYFLQNNFYNNAENPFHFLLAAFVNDEKKFNESKIILKILRFASSNLIKNWQRKKFDRHHDTINPPKISEKNEQDFNQFYQEKSIQENSPVLFLLDEEMTKNPLRFEEIKLQFLLIAEKMNVFNLEDVFYSHEFQDFLQNKISENPLFSKDQNDCDDDLIEKIWPVFLAKLLQEFKSGKINEKEINLDNDLQKLKDEILDLILRNEINLPEIIMEIKQDHHQTENIIKEIKTKISTAKDLSGYEFLKLAFNNFNKSFDGNFNEALKSAIADEYFSELNQAA